MHKLSLATMVALMLVLLAPAHGELMDVEIKAARKKGAETKSREEQVVTKVTTQVIYTITLDSKSFKPIQNLKVMYAIYYYDVAAGSTNKPVETASRGIETVPQLQANGTYAFDTKPLTLSSEVLDAGWHYNNGANVASSDKTSGVWVRAYADGKLVGEYVNPVSLPKRQEWNDKDWLAN